MKTLKLDISKAGVEITPRMEERTREALSLLYSKQGAGNDFLGWVTPVSSTHLTRRRLVLCRSRWAP